MFNLKLYRRVKLIKDNSYNSSDIYEIQTFFKQ